MMIQSRRFQYGSRESSPDDPAGPETLFSHLFDAAPDRPCGTSARQLRARRGSAQTVPPSIPDVHDTRAPVPRLRYTVPRPRQPARAAIRHPARTVACSRSARPAAPGHLSPLTHQPRTRSSSPLVHTCSTPTAHAAATDSLTRAAAPRRRTGSLSSLPLPIRLPPAAATSPASLAASSSVLIPISFLCTVHHSLPRGSSAP